VRFLIDFGVGFATFIAMFLLSVFSGMLSSYYERKR
jgi:hypothetical protein